MIKKRLDEEEESLLLQIERWLKQVIENIPAFATFEQISVLVLPGAGMLAPILANYAASIYSIGQAHADLEVEDILEKAGRKLADEDFLLPNVPRFEIWIKPVEAIKALQARQLILAGDFEADLLTQTKQALMERLLGVPRKDVEQRLQDILKINRNRAGLITTTETTYAYNRGRLAGFHAHGVDYVQFSAILDKRTSIQCRTRHGLIMRLDDPRLPANTPPLHGRCRSILKPVYSKYQGKEITHKSLDWSGVAPLPKGWRTETTVANLPGSGIILPKAVGAAANVIYFIKKGETVAEREARAYQYLRDKGYELPGVPEGVDYSERGRVIKTYWGPATVKYAFTMSDGQKVYHFLEREVDHILISRIEKEHEDVVKYIPEIPGIILKGKKQVIDKSKIIFTSKRKYRWEDIDGELKVTPLVVIVRKYRGIHHIDTLYPKY